MTRAELRYLESDAALNVRIEELSGKPPDSQHTSFVSSCLLHGRMFWESAAAAPLETRPLLLYYGAAAYAKALILATTGCNLQDLPRSHGLSCQVGEDELIANFRAFARGRGGRGLFQKFNDVVAGKNRLIYSKSFGQNENHVIPTAMSSSLTKFDVRLVDCLARIPGLATSFRLCTGNDQNLIPIMIDTSDIWRNQCSITVSISQRLVDRNSLVEIVGKIRARAPFLTRWRVGNASFIYGMTNLTFNNFPPPPDEIMNMTGGDGIFRIGYYPEEEPFDALASLPPLTGGYAGGEQRVAYAEPLAGIEVSEFSLIFAALLGLSSLVRYHPHIWTGCVHRRRVGERAVDDTLLPVIEEFLDGAVGRIPDLVVEVLLGR
jgi:hypothetical protein